MAGASTDKAVMIAAEITPPKNTQIIDFLKFIPKKAAIALPVHRPVDGKGTPTKAIKPISLYFSISLEPF